MNPYRQVNLGCTDIGFVTAQFKKRRPTFAKRVREEIERRLSDNASDYEGTNLTDTDLDIIETMIDDHLKMIRRNCALEFQRLLSVRVATPAS